MPVTRSWLEGELIAETSPFLTQAQLDLTTTDAHGRASLAGPIRTAIDQAGGTVLDPTAPADADVQSVPADRLDELFARAKLHLLYRCRSRLDVLTTSLGGLTVNWGAAVDAAIAAQEKYVSLAYGRPGGTVVGGRMSLGFAEPSIDHEADLSW